jgi:hypothetical protein
LAGAAPTRPPEARPNPSREGEDFPLRADVDKEFAIVALFD